jgi:hypothetical protein
MSMGISGLSAGQRETLEKHLPLLLGCAIVWLAARGLRRLFWEASGLLWVLYWTHPWRALW